MTKEELTAKLKNGESLQGLNLQNSDLRETDLKEANLTGADLTGADLTGADLDFSCWPLWCGTSQVIVDRRLFCQLIAHVCAVSCDDPDAQLIQSYLLRFAKNSHRAADLDLFKDAQEIIK